VFLARRYKNFFYAIFLTIVFVFLFQYYQQIITPPDEIDSQKVINGVEVVMSYPEIVYVGDEYPDRLEFKIKAPPDVPDDLEIFIEIDDADGEWIIETPTLTLELNASKSAFGNTIFYYDQPKPPEDDVTIKASIEVGNEEGDLEEKIAVENAPKDFLVSMVTFITAAAAIINLIVQIRKLFSKNG